VTANRTDDATQHRAAHGVYETRFDDRDVATKMAVWAVLARYLGRWVDPNRPILDIACDAGYFIANVAGRERWASDIRDISGRLPADVRFVQTNGLELEAHVPAGHFGTVFMSNYLEHLMSQEEVVEQLRVAARLLAPGGRVVVLQPNVRLTGGTYWDFIDHRVPLTDRSLVEAANLAGLRREHLITRFLPYTSTGRLPHWPFLVRLYLALPIAWRLLGQQTLYVGTLA
jgi:SAM-dependent methyltransferase